MFYYRLIRLLLFHLEQQAGLLRATCAVSRNRSIGQCWPTFFDWFSGNSIWKSGMNRIRRSVIKSNVLLSADSISARFIWNSSAISCVPPVPWVGVDQLANVYRPVVIRSPWPRLPLEPCSQTWRSSRRTGPRSPEKKSTMLMIKCTMANVNQWTRI